MQTNHITMKNKQEILNNIYREIQLVYKNDNRPWVIGYSGGKDSTLTTMLVFEAIALLPKEERTKLIHVVSSDTLVENPLILNFLKTNMDLMNEFAKKSNLNIKAQLVAPIFEDTFWSLLIGKGYPSPRQKFRWCTSRLKIKPIDVYINNVAEENNGVIVVLGVRSSESNSRRQTIQENSVDGKILKKHATNKNAYVYAPIEHLSNDDVWTSLIGSITPWKTENDLLLSLYRDASDESECPIQQDTNAPSCGQSRFGCWTCTVVSKDKSLTGFIQNGYDELRPLLRFRNFLCDIREDDDLRQNYRMNGAVYYLGKGKDEEKRRGKGPFNLKGRKLILEELLKSEVEFNNNLKKSESNRFSVKSSKKYNLITKRELELIRASWISDGDWEDSLPIIYKEVTGEDYYKGYINQPFFIDEDLALLENICEEENIDINVLKSLITLENKYLGMKKRSGILESIGRILNQDIIHEEILELKQGENYEDH